jgi:hypothetical protein
MKIMTTHSSATPREETSNMTNASLEGHTSAKSNVSPEVDVSSNIADSSKTIDASIKKRARLLLSKSSIPGKTRSLIRYALMLKDPYLAQVVRRVEAGEMLINCIYAE